MIWKKGKDIINLYFTYIDKYLDCELSEAVFTEVSSFHSNRIGCVRCNIEDTDRIKNLILKSCNILTLEDDNYKSSGIENYETKVIIPEINMIMKTIKDNNIDGVDYYVDMPGYPEDYGAFPVIDVEPLIK